MSLRQCLAAAVALLALGLADPSAARTHRTHARATHRPRRVSVIRSGYVTAAYVPAPRTTSRPLRAPPAGPAATSFADAHDLWSNERAPVTTAVRRVRPVTAIEASARIPEDRFAVLFGPERPFRLSMMPVRVAGSYRQFQNGGYWFTVLDPVPRSWPDDWYDTDAATIVERDGGYFLVDASHPADALALRVTVAE